MKKNLLKELILPSFWLFFFLVYSTNNDAKVSNVKNVNNAEIKTRQDRGILSKINKDKEATFTKGVYLSGF